MELLRKVFALGCLGLVASLPTIKEPGPAPGPPMHPRSLNSTHAGTSDGRIIADQPSAVNTSHTQDQTHLHDKITKHTTEMPSADVTSNLDLTVTHQGPQQSTKPAAANVLMRPSVELFPEFLPMELKNGTETVASGEEVIAGSGDGEIVDLSRFAPDAISSTPGLESSTAPDNISSTPGVEFSTAPETISFTHGAHAKSIPSHIPGLSLPVRISSTTGSMDSFAENTTGNPDLTTLLSTELTSDFTLPPENSDEDPRTLPVSDSFPTPRPERITGQHHSTTKASIAFYKHREGRLISPIEINETAWQLPFLPEERNQPSDDVRFDGVEKSIEGHPEGWTPFTISHSNLPKFLFSTLMMEPLATSTPAFPSRIATTTRLSFLEQGRKLATIFEDVTESTTSEMTEMVTTTEGTTMGVVYTSHASTVGRSSQYVRTFAQETTHPKPMIYWSDTPTVEPEVTGPNRIFEDDGVVGQSSVQDPASLRDAMESMAKHNLSRQVLDNLVTFLLKYVGPNSQEAIFGQANKKILTEIIFWPIMHQSDQLTVTTETAPIESNGVVQQGAKNQRKRQVDGPVTWPVLHFLAPTPWMLKGTGGDDSWVVTAYAAYQNAVPGEKSDIIPSSQLLTLLNQAQLKLMTKMNMQLVRALPGLPSFPFNESFSPIGKGNGTGEYHPLFERFSSLFIPLIVLASICAFVAIITVVCLVKKAQAQHLQQEQKDSHDEKILRPIDMLGVENPVSDEVIKAGESGRFNGTNGKHLPPANALRQSNLSAKEMYETEGWPMDGSNFQATNHPRRGAGDEEDTKL